MARERCTLPGGAERRNAGGGQGFDRLGYRFSPPLHRLLRIFCGGADELGGLHAPPRLLCLLVGYLCGGFLTAELVARTRTGSAAALGTGNPGMANLAHELGKGWGAVVLAGDIAKTALAWAVPGALPALGGLSGLWAGLECSAGPQFPPLAGLPGRKGVAVTRRPSSSSPLWGACPSCRTGRHPALRLVAPGGGGDPALFVPPGFLCRPGGRVADLILALIMLSRHIGGWAASSGREGENSVAAGPLAGQPKILRILPFRRRFVV